MIAAASDGAAARVLLAGGPLDRDERAVIVGEVLRPWALEARPPGPPAPEAPTSAPRLGYSSPRSLAAKRS